MAGRIASVRAALVAALSKLEPGRDWAFITRQIGMFSFTGMTAKQARDFPPASSALHAFLRIS